MTTMVGTPRITRHLEAETEACICKRLDGCGGIEAPEVNCPEHGYKVELVKYHTHAVQVDRVNPGRTL